jgi:hypothetical protein
MFGRNRIAVLDAIGDAVLPDAAITTGRLANPRAVGDISTLRKYSARVEVVVGRTVFFFVPGNFGLLKNPHRFLGLSRLR